MGARATAAVVGVVLLLIVAASCGMFSGGSSDDAGPAAVVVEGRIVGLGVCDPTGERSDARVYEQSGEQWVPSRACVGERGSVVDRLMEAAAPSIPTGTQRVLVPAGSETWEVCAVPRSAVSAEKPVGSGEVSCG